MITAFFQRSGNRFTGFTVSGHAGTAPEGQDLVCAAVSACVEMTANGITDVLGLPAEVTAKTDTVRLVLPVEQAGRESDCLLRTLHFMLEQLQTDYPEAVLVRTLTD